MTAAEIQAAVCAMPPGDFEIWLQDLGADFDASPGERRPEASRPNDAEIAHAGLWIRRCQTGLFQMCVAATLTHLERQ